MVFNGICNGGLHYKFIQTLYPSTKLQEEIHQEWQTKFKLSGYYRENYLLVIWQFCFALFWR
jgi:hypothetical protein